MITLERSRYGNPTPTFYLARTYLEGVHSKPALFRERAAAVYRLAAHIEEATAELPPYRSPSTGLTRRESWVVVPDTDAGCVRLELADGGTDEADRGMALLRAVERA